VIGGTVERTAGVGDQGVDLFVVRGAQRTAVQAKGYFNSVGNDAVQQVVAGMAHYGCNACAVITNSHFTISAKALAESNRCLLIGEEELPNFVLGKIAF
jgi:restriction system protein